MMPDSTTSAEPESCFLGVPLEIRRQIYHYLLADPSICHLSDVWEDEDDSSSKDDGAKHPLDPESDMWDYDEYQGDFYEHNFFSDSASDRDYAALAMSESNTQRGHKAPWEEDTDEEDEVDLDQELKVQRFPAILRTNRQIYSEASAVLYSGLSLYLRPENVLCMNAGKDIVEASDKVWRHNPLHGIGTTNQSGQTVYATPELDGFMEPHVFARFTQITFDVDLLLDEDTMKATREAESTQQGQEDQNALVAPSLFVNDNLTINPQDEAKLLAFYKRSTMIHQFVKILSNSPNIVRLQVELEIEVLARWANDLDSDSDSESDEDEPSEMTKKYLLANERAIDLFLDSGLLAPLEKLSNVQTFQIEFELAQDRNQKPYKPSSKHAAMLSDLKQKIESNYAVRVG